MSFFYSTERVSVRTDLPNTAFDPLKCDAVKCYLEHFQNELTLTWFADHGTMKEKQQAQAELEICRRKMAYWRRQPHFVQARATEAINTLKRKMRQ